MRSEAALLIRSAVTWSIPRGQIALRPPAGPLLAPIRPVSTSPSLLKKSKAASTKQSHQQSKEDHPEAESSRYENSPEGELDKVLERTKGKMSKSVDWARGIAYESVERGRGRISPG